jgi:flagellar basal-body rod protein FlgF
MDKLLYTAMTGAKHTLGQQATVANNLANAATHGFRAEFAMLRAVPIQGDGLATRAFVVDSTPGSDFTPGPIQQTGRPLDAAIQGEGWIAVQLEDGSEGYTRDGNFQVGPNGLLQTRGGALVLGDGGPIAMPPDVRVQIADDGTVSTVPTGNNPNQVAQLGRIKLVNPPPEQLERGGDGFFRLKSGQPAEAAAEVKLAAGSLEGSNVNVVEQMVSMIALARQFDIQTKMMQNAEGNDQRAAQLLSHG